MKLVVATIAFFMNAMLANAQCGLYFDKGSNNYNCCMDKHCNGSYGFSGWEDLCNKDSDCKWNYDQNRCVYDTPYPFSCSGKGKGKGAPVYGKGKGKGYGPEPYADKCYGYSKNMCRRINYCGWNTYWKKCYDLPGDKYPSKGKGYPAPSKGKGKGTPEPYYADKCYGFEKKKCKKKDFCGWDSYYKLCYDIVPSSKGKGKGAYYPPPPRECYGLNKNKCKKKAPDCKWQKDPAYGFKVCMKRPKSFGKGKGGEGIGAPPPRECYGLHKIKCKAAPQCRWQMDPAYGFKVCMKRPKFFN